jgi:hypothetical protein
MFINLKTDDSERSSRVHNLNAQGTDHFSQCEWIEVLLKALIYALSHHCYRGQEFDPPIP